MKIVSLNTWGGRGGPELIDFFARNREIDMFLLQEVFHEATEHTIWVEGERAQLFNEIQVALPDHLGYFASCEADEWGLAAFVQRNIPVIETGDVFVHRWRDALVGRDGMTLGRNLQYLKIKSDPTDLTICNFHGLWNGNGKTDTEERLQQSAKILEFINADSSGNPIILAGDFNLNPDTESIMMLEKDMRNLIKEYGITSTRTSFYEKENKFADYMLVSSAITVKDFNVLPDEVSDHAALYLEI